jgi:hypothetical protein
MVLEGDPTVNPALDPDVAVRVARSAVAGIEDAGVWLLQM